MSAYLYYQVANKEDLAKAKKLLLESKKNDAIFELGEQDITLIDQDTVKWAKENGGLVSYYEDRIGHGNIQMTSVSEKAESMGYDEEGIRELQTEVFEELNKHIDMKYLANSCAFTEEEYYFTIEQMKRITNNGQLLSGKTSKDEDTVKKYAELLALLSKEEPGETFECISCGCEVEEEGEMCEECEEEMSCCCTSDCEIEYDDEDSIEYDEDFEESPKTPKKPAKQTKNKDLISLEAKFDVVEVEEHKMFQLLTIKDKSPNPSMDWVVWLQVKVAYADTNTCSKSSEDKLHGAFKAIVDWLPLLLEYRDDQQTTQLSLFGDEESDDELKLEPEPESPSGENENWAKYFREQEAVRKRNLIKQYSFFELCDLVDAWYMYEDADFRHHLPKSDEEMTKVVKDAIIRGVDAEKSSSRADDVGWDNSYGYISKNKPLSDDELFSRINTLLRISLVPYRVSFHVSTDNSYSAWKHEERVSYRYEYRASGKGEIKGWGEILSKELPKYNIKTPEFIAWARGFFEVPYAEVAQDEDILKTAIEQYFRSSAVNQQYDVETKAGQFKDWKALRNDHLTQTHNNRNGSMSGSSIDGYSIDVEFRKKGKVEVKQDMTLREGQGKSIEGLKRYKYNNSQVIVYELEGDEIYKEAFRLYGKNKASLFDSSLGEIVDGSDNIIIASIGHDKPKDEPKKKEELCTQDATSEDGVASGVCATYDIGYGILIDGYEYVLKGVGGTIHKFRPLNEDAGLETKLIRHENVSKYETFKYEDSPAEKSDAPLLDKKVKTADAANNVSFGTNVQLSLF